MSVHLQPKSNFLKTQFWQYIWPFFNTQNFVIFTDQNKFVYNQAFDFYKQKNCLFFTSSNHQAKAYQAINNVQEGLQFSTDLKKHTANVIKTYLPELKSASNFELNLEGNQNKNKAEKGGKKKETIKLKADLEDEMFKTKFVWNYLGRNEEKQQYIEYLNTLFWQNQHEEALQNHPNYNQMLNNTWKIPLYANTLPFTVAHPCEFFSDKTTDFIQNLQKTMANWSINPYFLWQDEGSFQWSIQIGDLFLIQGAVWQTKDGLKHAIECNDL